MRIADAHIHFFRNGYPDSQGQPVLGARRDIDVYEDYRATHGIGDALIVGYEGNGVDPSNNAYIRELAADRPWMHTVAYVPCSIDAALGIPSLLAAGHVGVTFYVATTADAAEVCRFPAVVWEALNTHKAIISLNAPPAATKALTPAIHAAGAETTFMFSHVGLPGPHDHAPGDAAARARLAPLLALAALPNVNVKISALYAISGYPHDPAQPFVAAVLNHFGAERCVWASDFSPALEFVTFPQTLDIAALETLSAEDREAVMGGNLTRLLQRRQEV